MGRIHDRLGGGFRRKQQSFVSGRQSAFDARSILIRKRSSQGGNGRSSGLQSNRRPMLRSQRFTTLSSPAANVKKLINFTIVAPNVPVRSSGKNVVDQRLRKTVKNVVVGRAIRAKPTAHLSYDEDEMDVESSSKPVQRRGGPSAMFINAMKEAELDHTPYEPVRRATAAPPMLNARARLGPTVSTTTSQKGIRLLFTNLAATVSNDDVQELCSSVNGLVRAGLIEPGLAEAVYTTRKAAEEAVNLYDKRQLDGVSMNVQIVEAAKSKLSPAIDTKKNTAKSSTLTIDRELITSALFPQTKEQDGISFTVKI